MDVRFGSKADVCGAKRHVRFTPNSDIDCVFQHVCFWPKATSRHLMSAYAVDQITAVGKLHLKPRCIARKPNASRLSDTQECFPDPRRRLGKAALRLCHTGAQDCSPMRGILLVVRLGSFVSTVARWLLALARQMGRPLARRCTVSLVLCRKHARPPCFALEQS